MSPADASVALPTRSEIEEWDTSFLTTAASAWKQAATASEEAFDQHRQNIASPGGTTWEGDAKDAAIARVTADVAVVGRQGDVLREAADLAENGCHDITAARDKAVEAITAAEDDGFSVGEDLSVTDSRKYDITTIVERNRAAAEHAEDIRWAAEQLAAADKLVGTRLQSKAAELEGIRFDGEGDARNGHVQLVDNEVKPDAEDKDQPGEKKPEVPAQAPGQLGPFAVPKAVEDAAKEPDGKVPDPSNPDPSGLGDLLGANDHPEDKPGEGKLGDEKPAGLPPALSQLPKPPDKSAIDQQRARVEAARQSLAAAEAKQKAALGQGYVQGAGSGTSPDEFRSLTQAVFDARRELAEQTDALRDLSAASAANGGPAVPVPPLPSDADRQAFPPPPSVADRLAEASHEISENTFGLVPDVAKNIDTFMNWDQASGADKTQAILDSAGMLPLPFGKPLTEGLEHGLDIFSGGARHLDDVPTPNVDVDRAPTPHGQADAPSGGHAPVEHHASEPVNSPDPIPTHQHPADVFDPNQGLHYTSGDAHYPGGWPPSTPPETWSPGNTNPGWHYIDRGPDKDWMPYQEQISGAERLPDGRIPEYARIDPDSGKTVNFDGHDIRGGHEVFLDAKDGYSALATDPGRPWTQGMEQSILNEIPRQLRALPPGASLEIHVSDPSGAAAIRNLVEENDWFDVTVIYTPKAP
ncbi:hypothetical protein ABQF34_10195 [Mycolicibacterium boenickei]